MKRLFLIVAGLAAGCTLGCAVNFTGHGAVAGKYPPTVQSADVAMVTIVRQDTVPKGGYYGISIDGETSYNIDNGEKITFQIEPGERRFGITGYNPWTFQTSTHEISVACEPGKAYDLLVSAHFHIAPTIELTGAN